MRVFAFTMLSFVTSINGWAQESYYPTEYSLECSLQWTALGSDPHAIAILEPQMVEGSESADFGWQTTSFVNLPEQPVLEVEKTVSSKVITPKVNLFPLQAPSWYFQFATSIEWGKTRKVKFEGDLYFKVPVKIEYWVFLGEGSNEVFNYGVLAEDEAYLFGPATEENGSINFLTMHGEYRGTWDTASLEEGGRQGVFNCQLNAQ